MSYIKKVYQRLLVIGLAIFYVGCASSLSGPLFKPATDIPTDKSIIYLYRPDAGHTTEFLITYNNMEICDLQSGGYFPFYAEEGRVDITSTVNFKMFSTGLFDQAFSGSTDLVFEAEPGKSYYLECRGHQNLSIKLVPESYGISSIKECRLLEPISP